VAPRAVPAAPEALGMWGHGYDSTKNDKTRYYEIRPAIQSWALGPGTRLNLAR
jgi:hypothetical protein